MLTNELCVGEPLTIVEDYIVITTKVKYFHLDKFKELAGPLKQTIIELSKKYKIVLMGEKVVEKNAESIKPVMKYSTYGFWKGVIPPASLVDLTVERLGLAAPELSKLQRDCVIMNNAKGVICFGYGGNLVLGAAVGNVFGLLQPMNNYEVFTQSLFSNSPNVFVTIEAADLWAKLNVL